MTLLILSGVFRERPAFVLRGYAAVPLTTRPS